MHRKWVAAIGGHCWPSLCTIAGVLQDQDRPERCAPKPRLCFVTRREPRPKCAQVLASALHLMRAVNASAVKRGAIFAANSVVALRGGACVAHLVVLILWRYRRYRRASRSHQRFPRNGRRNVWRRWRYRPRLGAQSIEQRIKPHDRGPVCLRRSGRP